MIDMSLMKGVRVDPASSTVRVEAGCTSGDVDHATHAFGLAVPFGIVSTTGVAGLTLGGGIGYLSRKYGLTIDNLLEADVVLADGSIVTASPSQNADLFWGLRGGGGNFGIVTSFLFRAHPVKTVFAGPVFWDIEHAAHGDAEISRFPARRAGGARRLRRPEDGSAGRAIPRRASGQAGLRHHRLLQRPGGGGRGRHGAAAEGAARAALQLDERNAVSRAAIHVRPVPAEGHAMVLERRLRRTNSTDEAIDAHIAQARQTPSALSLMHLYPIDGAVHRVGKNDTAWNTRDATWAMVIAGIDHRSRGTPGDISRLDQGAIGKPCIPIPMAAAM